MSQSAFCHKQDSVMRDAAAFVDGERQMMHKSYNLYHRIVDNTIVNCVMPNPDISRKLWFLPQLDQDHGASLHQVFLDDGKWTAIEKVSFWFPELFQGLEGGSKRSLFLRAQLHKMQHGRKSYGKKEVV